MGFDTDPSMTPNQNNFLKAAQNGKSSILISLFEQDESIIEAKDGHGDTALILASRHANKKVINLLIKNFGMDAFERGLKNRTCFHNAILFKNTNNLKHLHKLYPALISCKDNDGNTALTLSCLHLKTQITELLVKLGADFTKTGNLKRTAFHC